MKSIFLIIASFAGLLQASTPLSVYGEVVPTLDEYHSALSIVHGMAYWRGCRFAQALTLNPWKWVEHSEGDEIVYKPDPISELARMLFGAVQNTVYRVEVQPTRKKGMVVTHMDMSLLTQILIKLWNHQIGEDVIFAEDVLNLCKSSEHFMNSVKEADLEWKRTKSRIQALTKDLKALQNPADLKKRIGSLSGILHGNKNPVAEKIMKSINSLQPFDTDELLVLGLREDRLASFRQLAEELKNYDEISRPKILQLQTDFKLAEQKIKLMANQASIMANLEKFSQLLVEIGNFWETKLYRYNTPLALIQAYIFARWPSTENIQQYYVLIKAELPDMEYSYEERNVKFTLSGAPINLSTSQLEAMAFDAQPSKYSDISYWQSTFNNVQFTTCMEATIINAILSASFSAERGDYTDERASELAKIVLSSREDPSKSMEGLVGPWYMKVAKENNPNRQYYELTNTPAVAFIHRRGLPKTAKKVSSITLSVADGTADFDLFSIPKDGDFDKYERVLAVYDDGMVGMELFPHPRNLLFFMDGKDAYSPDTSLAELSEKSKPAVQIESVNEDTFYAAFETDYIVQNIELNSKHGSNTTKNKNDVNSTFAPSAFQPPTICEASSADHIEANFLFAQPQGYSGPYQFVWSAQEAPCADLTSSVLNLDRLASYESNSMFKEWIARLRTEIFGDRVSIEDVNEYFGKRKGLKKHVAMLLNGAHFLNGTDIFAPFIYALFESLSTSGQVIHLRSTCKYPGIIDRISMIARKRSGFSDNLYLVSRFSQDVAIIAKSMGQERDSILKLFPWLQTILIEGGDVSDIGFCRQGKEWIAFAAFPEHFPAGCSQYADDNGSFTMYRALASKARKRWRKLQLRKQHGLGSDDDDYFVYSSDDDY